MHLRQEEGVLRSHDCVLIYRSEAERDDSHTPDGNVIRLTTKMLTVKRLEEFNTCCPSGQLEKMAFFQCMEEVEKVQCFLEESSSEQDSRSGQNEVGASRLSTLRSRPPSWEQRQVGARMLAHRAGPCGKGISHDAADNEIRLLGARGGGAFPCSLPPPPPGLKLGAGSSSEVSDCDKQTDATTSKWSSWRPHVCQVKASPAIRELRLIRDPDFEHVVWLLSDAPAGILGPGFLQLTSGTCGPTGLRVFAKFAALGKKRKGKPWEGKYFAQLMRFYRTLQGWGPTTFRVVEKHRVRAKERLGSWGRRGRRAGLRGSVTLAAHGAGGQHHVGHTEQVQAKEQVWSHPGLTETAPAKDERTAPPTEILQRQENVWTDEAVHAQRARADKRIAALGVVSQALWVPVNVPCAKEREMGLVLRKSLVTEKLREEENPQLHMTRCWTRVPGKSSVFVERTVVNSTKGDALAPPAPFDHRIVTAKQAAVNSFYTVRQGLLEFPSCPFGQRGSSVVLQAGPASQHPVLGSVKILQRGKDPRAEACRVFVVPASALSGREVISLVDQRGSREATSALKAVCSEPHKETDRTSLSWARLSWGPWLIKGRKPSLSELPHLRSCSHAPGKNLISAAGGIESHLAMFMDEVKNEISVMNQLDHVNLVQLYDAFESKNDIVLVMEYVDGGELFDRIIDDNCNLTEFDTILFIRQICEGIRHMHQMNILHLDLKPENILCVNRDTKQIKIIDFGLARRYKPREKLKVNFGTPEFLAPEVVNYDFVSFPTDMWSVGVIAYMLLSGLSPFLGDSDAETLNNILACRWDLEDAEFQDISEEAREFIAKLLVKEKRMGKMSGTGAGVTGTAVGTLLDASSEQMENAFTD
ncbi:hypothetical protein CB1_000218023 [Camelus ferus]|nr:hypothetical protein CB1_000218023 [Camelus ferus]